MNNKQNADAAARKTKIYYIISFIAEKNFQNTKLYGILPLVWCRRYYVNQL